MLKEKVTIVLADDHPIFRRGLVDTLEDAEAYHVVGEAGDGNEAIALITRLKPHIAILDISMPQRDGLDVLVKAQHWASPPIFVILTLYDDESYLKKALEYGAKGYLLKDNAETELITCLDMVSIGKTYLSPGVAWRLVEGTEQSHDSLEQLSTAERRIFTLVSEFKTNAEIAELLSVSIRTVQNHRSNICKKFGLSGAHALTQFAARFSDSTGAN
ncbi:oxygen regulatory protein NreC [bacterium BMS3Bbin11]|nr:oxygen regulatory protein NreC [bacterium BMS3Abin11]GBE45546.1 oxygen regulatory protein NreC [bacterium BMS3Bbin11]GMT40815.1 MAG: DNA-binding response regulator [bacterium]HDH15724.1 response regulator transcription factor [Gammaproteobacteria bacterium]HDZ79380.1 response regulator transcription factor [Gammaproteobacteria bacterium]